MKDLDCTFNNISVDYPASVFKDAAVERHELQNSISSSSTLKEFGDKLDKLLLPVVKCPWGESEFFHKCGSVPFDAMVCKMLGPHNVPIISKDIHKKLQLLQGARDDYSSLDAGDHVEWYLENDQDPDWCCAGSCAFVEGKGLVLLTCRDHDGGTKDRYLHPPKSPMGILPNIRGDNLAPVTTVPRTIKPVRCGAFCHTYQMHEMRGEFNGIDTLRVADCGRFDTDSNLRQQHRNATIAGRHDIRSMATNTGWDL